MPWYKISVDVKFEDDLVENAFNSTFLSTQMVNAIAMSNLKPLAISGMSLVKAKVLAIEEPEESNLVQHVRRELELINEMPEVIDAAIKIAKIFSDMGHSGYSGMFFIEQLTRLLKFENLSPLTDDPDEWYKHDYGDKKMWQNKRNGGAFSYDGGSTYYLLSENHHKGKTIKRTFHPSKRVNETVEDTNAISDGE